QIGMAVKAASNGSAEGFALFDQWRASAPDYDADTVRKKWDGFHPTQIGFGTLSFYADKAAPGWRERYEARQQEENERSNNEQARSGTTKDTTTPVFDPWQPYIVPAFPLDILPLEVQDYVSSQSSIVGCDISGTAMSALGTFSGALHHKFALKMQRHGKWYVSPQLLILFVVAASQRKTPMFKDVTRPLVDYEIYVRQKHQHELREYEEAKEQGDGKTKLQKPKPPILYFK